MKKLHELVLKRVAEQNWQRAMNYTLKENSQKNIQYFNDQERLKLLKKQFENQLDKRWKQQSEVWLNAVYFSRAIRFIEKNLFNNKTK